LNKGRRQRLTLFKDAYIISLAFHIIPVENLPPAL